MKLKPPRMLTSWSAAGVRREFVKAVPKGSTAGAWVHREFSASLPREEIAQSG